MVAQRKLVWLGLGLVLVLTLGAAARADYASTILADTPSVFYRFGETSGPTAADLSGFGRDGTYNGTITYNQPGLGPAIDPAITLNGTNGYVEVPYTAVGDWWSISQTFEVWFKTTSNGVLFGQDGNGYVPGLYVGNDGKLRGSLFWHGGNQDAIQVAVGAAAVNDGNWHHAAVTYDASGGANAGVQKLYLDGQQVASLSGLRQDAYTGQAAGNYSYHVGRGTTGGWPSAPSGYFNGSIDEAAFYQSALSADRILAHFNAGLTQPTWNVNANGAWSNPGNWNSAGVPNAPGAAAVFGDVITQDRVVTVDSDFVTVGSMTFDNAHKYTIAAGPGAVYFQVPTGSAQVTVKSGSHEISAPVGLANNLGASVAANGTLTFSSGISDGGANLGITKTGPGTININSVVDNPTRLGGATTVNQGALNFTGTESSTVGTLTAAGGATVSAPNGLTVLSQLNLPERVTVSATGTTFKATGANLANNSAARILTFSGGTLKVSAGGGVGDMVPLANITATAGNNNFADASNTVRWDSLMSTPQPDKAALQGTAYQQMWTPLDATATWIQWDLGAKYDLSEIFLWQYNQGTVGNRSIKTVDIYYAENPTGHAKTGGTGWTKYDPGNFPWPQASGLGNDHTVVDMQNLGISARYVEFDVTSSWAGGGDVNGGLSKILFFQTASPLVNLPATAISVTAGSPTSTLDLGSPTVDHTLGALTLAAAPGGNTLTIANANSLTFGGGIAVTDTGTAAIAGSATLKVPVGQSINVPLDAALTISTPIGGASAVNKTGQGTLALAGANNYTGPTALNAGVLKIMAGGSLGQTSSLTVSNGTSVELDTGVSLSLDAPVSGGTLNKTGPGALFLNNVSNTQAGTIVNAGTFGGSGTLANGVTVAASSLAHLAPGPGLGLPGTLTVSALTLASGGGDSIDFDLGPLGGSDRIAIGNALTVAASGKTTLNFNRVAGFVPGVYTLMNFGSGPAGATAFQTGTLTGNLVLNSISKVGNAIVADVGLSAPLKTWTGAADGTTWDTATANWSGTSTTFADNDQVQFNDTANTTVAVSGTRKVAAVVFNNSVDYTLNGPGMLADADGGFGAALAKNGSGTLTIGDMLNEFTGGVVVNEGTVAVANLPDAGSPGPLGTGPLSLGSTTTPGTLRYTGAGAAPSSTRALTVNLGGGKVAVDNPATNLTLTGAVAGTGALTKNGPGALSLSGRVNLTGAGATHVVGAGTLTLTNLAAGLGANNLSGQTFQVNNPGTPAVLAASATATGTNPLAGATVALAGGTLQIDGAIPGTMRPTAGMVRHYSFNDPAKPTADSVNSQDGTLQNGALYAGPQPGREAFGGVLYMPHRWSGMNVPSTGYNSSWTASTWYANMYGTDNWRTLLRGDNFHPVIIEQGSWRLGAFINGFQPAKVPGTNTDYSVPAALQSGWHQFTAVGTAANETEFYIDGNLVAVLGMKDVQNVLGVGHAQWNDQTFAQYLDDFRYYNRALGPAEVAQILAPVGNAAMTSTAIRVLDNSTISKFQAGGVDLGPLTFAANGKTLTTSLASGTFTFPSLTLGAGVTSAAYSSLAETVITGGVNDGGQVVTITKQGEGGLTIAGNSSLQAASVLNVQAGALTLLGSATANPLGSGKTALDVQAGLLQLSTLSAAGSTAIGGSIDVNQDYTFTAGTFADGVASGVDGGTIALAGGGIALASGKRLSVNTLNNYVLLFPVATSADAASQINVTGGTLAIGHANSLGLAAVSVTNTGTVLESRVAAPMLANVTVAPGAVLQLSADPSGGVIPTAPIAGTYRLNTDVGNNFNNVRLADKAVVQTAGGARVYDSTLKLAGAVTVNTAGGDLRINTPLTNDGTANGGIVKINANTLTLGPTAGGPVVSTYTGSTNVNGGTLVVPATGALGGTSAVTVRNPGSTLTANGPVTSTGAITVGPAAAMNVNAPVIARAEVHSAGAFTVAGGKTLTIQRGTGAPLGTIAWYAFDDPADWGKDSIGGFNMTVTGTPAAASSFHRNGAIQWSAGQSMELTGDDFTPLADALAGSTGQTLVLWLKRAAADINVPQSSGIFGGLGTDSNNHYTWSDQNAYLNTFRANRQAINWSGTSAIQQDWHMLTIVRDQAANTWKVYLNDTEKYSTDAGTFNISNFFRLALNEYGNDWPGAMDDVMVLNRAMSGAEVAQLHAAPPPTGASLSVSDGTFTLDGTLELQGDKINQTGSATGSTINLNGTFIPDGTGTIKMRGGTAWAPLRASFNANIVPGNDGTGTDKRWGLDLGGFGVYYNANVAAATGYGPMSVANNAVLNLAVPGALASGVAINLTDAGSPIPGAAGELRINADAAVPAGATLQATGRFFVNVAARQTTGQVPYLDVGDKATVGGDLTGFTILSAPGSGHQNIYLRDGAIFAGTAGAAPTWATQGNGARQLWLGMTANNMAGIYTVGTDGIGAGIFGKGVMIGNWTHPSGDQSAAFTGTIRQVLDPLGDGNVQVLLNNGFALTLNNATLKINDPTKKYVFSEVGNLKLASPLSAGSSAKNFDVLGLGNRQNGEVLSLAASGALSAGQTWNVTDGIIGISQNNAIAAGALLNVGSGASLRVDHPISSGYVNLQASSALVVATVPNVIAAHDQLNNMAAFTASPSLPSPITDRTINVDPNIDPGHYPLLITTDALNGGGAVLATAIRNLNVVSARVGTNDVRFANNSALVLGNNRYFLSPRGTGQWMNDWWGVYANAEGTGPNNLFNIGLAKFGPVDYNTRLQIGDWRHINPDQKRYLNITFGSHEPLMGIAGVSDYSRVYEIPTGYIRLQNAAVMSGGGTNVANVWSGYVSKMNVFNEESGLTWNIQGTVHSGTTYTATLELTNDNGPLLSNQTANIRSNGNLVVYSNYNPNRLLSNGINFYDGSTLRMIVNNADNGLIDMDAASVTYTVKAAQPGAATNATIAVQGWWEGNWNAGARINRLVLENGSKLTVDTQGNKMLEVRQVVVNAGNTGEIRRTQSNNDPNPANNWWFQYANYPYCGHTLLIDQLNVAPGATIAFGPATDLTRVEQIGNSANDPLLGSLKITGTIDDSNLLLLPAQPAITINQNLEVADGGRYSPTLNGSGPISATKTFNIGGDVKTTGSGTLNVAPTTSFNVTGQLLNNGAVSSTGAIGVGPGGNMNVATISNSTGWWKPNAGSVMTLTAGPTPSTFKVGGAGKVVVPAATAMPVNSDVTVGDSGTLDLATATRQISTLTMTGGTLANGTAQVANSISLQSGTVKASLTGNAPMVKSGPGTATLQGVNTNFGGTVSITEGTLLLKSALGHPLAGAALWLDANNPATMHVVGGLVTQWDDAAGGAGNVAQGDPNRQPTYVQDAIGGLPAVHFSAAGTADLLYNVIDYPSSPNGVTIFSVSRLTGGSNLRLITATNNNWLLGYWGGGIDRAWFNDGWVSLPNTPADTAPHMYEAVIRGPGGNSDLYVYDARNPGVVQLASNQASVNGPNGLALGGWGTGAGEPSDGDVGEILIYNRVLTAEERAQVESYLKGKWWESGIGNAPVDNLPDMTPVNISAGATLQAATAETIGPLNGPAGAQVTLNRGSALLVNANAAAPTNFAGTANIGPNATLTINLSAQNTYAPTINLQAVDSTFAAVANSPSSFGGTFSGPGTFTKDGPSSLAIQDQPGFTGMVQIKAGALQVSSNVSLSNAILKVAAGDTGHLEVQGGATTLTFGGLTGNGAFAMPSGVTVRVGNNNQDTTFSGSLSGAATLQKIGNGTLTLAGPAAHTGAGAQDPTVVTSGTLNLTDGAHLTGNIDVQGGTLKITSFLLPANAAGVYTFDSVNGNAVSNEGTLGASYNATFQNSATTTPNGHKGPGLWLDNQNNAWLAVDLQPNGRGIDLSSGKWTASAWFNGIYTSGQGADWRTLFRGNSSDHQIIIQDGTWNLGCYANGNGEFRITDTAYQMNQVANSGWHQITAVGSGPNIKMYVDGLYVGQTDRNSIADIYAIGNGMGWTQKFAKAIDDVYIYQRDLNADEVYNLYGATSASGVGDAISDTAQVKLSAAGTLDVSGGETIGRLEGVAGSQVVLHDYSRLAVNPAALNTFPGTITGPETSTFAKTGAATFVLPGTYATFLGRTEVDAGTLQFTQSNNGPGTLVVKGGGTATAPGISTGRAVLLDGTAVNAAVLTLTNPGEASHVSSLGLPGSVANSLATLNLGGDGSSLLADSLSLANSARLTVNGPGVLTVAGGTLEAGTQVNLSTRMVASGVAGPGTIAVSDGGLLAGAPGMALITAPVQLNAGGAIDAGDGTAGAVVLLDALNIATAGRIHLGIGAGTNGAVNVASTLNFTGTPVVVVPNTVTAPSAYTFLTGAVPAAGPDWGLGVAGGSPNISWNNGDGAWDGTGPNYHWSGADTVQGYVDGYGTGALTVHITGAGALGPVATSNVLIGPLMTAANKTVIGPSAAAAVAQLTIGSNPHTGAALSVGAGDLTVSGVTTIASDGALLTGTSGPGGFSTGSLALAGQMTVGAATTATVVGTASATGTANLSVLGTLNADRLDANVTPGTGAVNFQAGAQGTIATLNVLAGSTTLAGSQAINTANFSGGVALMTSGSIGSGASGGANVNPGGDFRPSGGAINKLNVAGGTASVSGAAAVDKANVAGGTANVSGGSITTVDVTGGNATVTGGSIATANLNGGTLNVNNAAPIATLNVAGGTMNLSGVGATANTVVLTGGRIDTGTAALTVTNRMVLPDAYTATISRTSPADPPPSFTMAGSNLVDNAGTRTVTLSGGTLALTAVGGKIAYDPAWGVTVSDEFYSPGIRALDGSGLAPPNPTSDPQTHDAAYTNMWTMNENHRAGWLAIDFGLPTTVSKLHVWNYNQNWEVANGITARSAKNVELQTSLNGTDWTTFQTSVFPAAPGADGYAGFDLPLTSSQTTRYFRFNILDNQGGTLTGLSEVQFYKAGHPVDLPQTHVAVQAGAVTTLDLGDPANDHRLGNLVLSDDCFLTIAGAKSVAFQVVSNASNDEGVSAVEYSNPQGFSIPIVVQQVLRPQGVLNVNTDLVLDVGAAASLVLKAGAAEVYQHVNLMGNALTLGNGVLPAGDLLVSFGSTPPDGWAGTYDLFTGIYPGYLSGTFANDTTPPAAPTGYEWNVWPDGKWIKYDALGSDSNLAVKVQLNLMGIVGIESYWTHGSPVNNHWGNGDNWANGGVPRVPSQAGDTARFDTTAGSPSGGIVVIDGGGKSAAKLFFHSAGSYAITGSPLTLDNGFAPAEIHVSLGSHSIGAELRLASALTLLPAAGATLTLGDVSETSPGKTITLNDAGKVVLTGVSTYTGLTTVSRGELDITVASAWHAGNDLVIGAHGQVALAENLILAGSAATAVHVAPVSVSAVPEPGAWALLGAAATAALGMWWRRKARK